MTEQNATLTIKDGLARVTLARPKALNALNGALKGELLRLLCDVAATEGVRAVLLAAEGKHFCVGQDLAEHVEGLRRDRAQAMATVGHDYNPLLRALSDIRVPVVAALQGVCAGAGWGIAMAADIRVAGHKTSFRTAFVGIGLGPDSGLSHALVRCLGPSRAAGLLMLDDPVTAEQALGWGLVHRVVDDEQVQAEAEALAQRLAAGPTLALSRIKALVGASRGLDATLEDERRAQEMLGASDDHQAAVEAFLEKRKPEFHGR